MRLFLGIPLPSTTTATLSAISSRLRSTTDGLRWSTPESWHITLQFLGNTDARQYDCLIAQLQRLRHPPIPINFAPMGIFDRVGVFFVGIHTTPALLSLQQQVTATTAHCGFIAESRPYHPHITLARRKAAGQGLRTLKSLTQTTPTLPAFTTDVFLLYQSTPTPTGSRYDIREHFPLIP